jgi:hypothetical protein
MTTSDIEFWIHQAENRSKLGHKTAVILVPHGGYQTLPLEMAEKKYKGMIVYPKTIEKLIVPMVTLSEYVKTNYMEDMEK